MSYFSNFPVINYDFEGTGKNTVLCRDLTVGSKIVSLLNGVPDDGAYIKYQVRDGERPEHIAERLYGRADLHWLVLMANTIVDPYYEWPLSQQELNAFIDNKYPGTALFFDCKPDSLAFTYGYTGTTSKLTVEQSNFVEGNDVTQGSSTGVVVSWDPTLRKLVVDTGTFTAGSYVYSTNEHEEDFKVSPLKVVTENKNAIHHFVDDFGHHMNPYGYLEPYADGAVYSFRSIFESGLTAQPNYILNTYINGGNSFEAKNAVTNAMHETNVNDTKRSIRVLRTEYATSVISRLSTIFK